MNGRLAGLAVAGLAPLLGPPVLRVASGEARAQRSRQRLALLEAALPSQGILLLLVFPLLVLLLVLPLPILALLSPLPGVQVGQRGRITGLPVLS